MDADSQCSFFVGPDPSYLPHQTWVEPAIALIALASLLWSLRHGRPGFWTVVAILAAAGYLASAMVTALLVEGAFDDFASCRPPWVVVHSAYFDSARIVSVAVLVLSLLLLLGRRRRDPADPDREELAQP